MNIYIYLYSYIQQIIGESWMLAWIKALNISTNTCKQKNTSPSKCSSYPEVQQKIKHVKSLEDKGETMSLGLWLNPACSLGTGMTSMCVFPPNFGWYLHVSMTIPLMWDPKSQCHQPFSIRRIMYIYIYIHVCMYVCMNVCMYVCMNVWMYACMHACIYIYIYNTS